MELKVAGQVIETTAEHPFYVADKGWTNCLELQVGDIIRTEEGWSSVEAVVDTGRWETVYNFRIAENHTYFVGGDDWGFAVWAHNAECAVRKNSNGEYEIIHEKTGKIIGKTTDLRQLQSTLESMPLGGFKSFREFKKFYGTAGKDWAWHHLVEQTPNQGKYVPSVVHTMDNIIPLPHGKGSIHAKVSAYYSSIQPFTGGLTVRKYLARKSFPEQLSRAVEIVKEFGGSQYLPQQLR